jgi:hypothetical protein
MRSNFSEKLIAYLALLSGLSISAVAVYYSVIGLTAIFAAAAIPIIIMGGTLEVSKLVSTVWLKQNWKIAPIYIRSYLLIAIFLLMLITSLGCFGFLSKAHLDQRVPSGDIIAKVALYDEKIKVEKENIDADRKALKQMDEAVDQLMARSTDETGANRSVSIRRSQQKERARLLADIEKSQKSVAALNEERVPIASSMRKVEAEVGPIKYIAAFFYGSTDQAILEKSVTWVIIILIVVFDPLAVILLLASQYSFQKLREEKIKESAQVQNNAQRDLSERSTSDPVDSSAPVADTVTQPAFFPKKSPADGVELAMKYHADKYPDDDEYQEEVAETGDEKVIQETASAPLESSSGKPNPPLPSAPVVSSSPMPMGKTFDWASVPPEQDYVTIDGQHMSVQAGKSLYPQTTNIPTGYVQNEEQLKSNLWQNISTSTQISEKEYFEATERNIDEIVKDVKSGKIPFYKVPHEIQEKVKQKLQNDNENNVNYTP